MTATLIAIAGLLLLFAWFVLGGRDDRHEPTARRRTNDAVDYAELEAAERDVQEAADEDSVRDWGPGGGGASRSRRLARQCDTRHLSRGRNG